jgi:hypothetical protein
MEYRIKQQHRLKGVSYLTPSYANRIEAEAQLQVTNSANTDIDAVYTVVYGQFYSQGAENGTFAEFPEPTN